MSELTVMSGDGIVYDIVLGEPYEVVWGFGGLSTGDLISFKKNASFDPAYIYSPPLANTSFVWLLNNVEKGILGSYAKFQTVFRPCSTMSLADMLKECLE